MEGTKNVLYLSLMPYTLFDGVNPHKGKGASIKGRTKGKSVLLVVLSSCKLALALFIDGGFYFLLYSSFSYDPQFVQQVAIVHTNESR